ncbi:MAG: helix-turn-helix domain-containing protein [Eubacteriales bacterium]
MPTFNKRFKELRKEKNLTQQELADKFYLNKSSISRYEQGKQMPEIDQLQKFADFFGVSIDYLLGKTDIRDPYNCFVMEAECEYGPRGKKQAEELLEGVQAMFDGGELPDEDRDEFFRAITEIYFESKEKNKKYTPKKYRKKTE